MVRSKSCAHPTEIRSECKVANSSKVRAPPRSATADDQDKDAVTPVGNKEELTHAAASAHTGATKPAEPMSLPYVRTPTLPPAAAFVQALARYCAHVDNSRGRKKRRD